MNQEQRRHIGQAKGFIAALDQSGGSTPGALARYGVEESDYSNEDEMFNLVHEFRTRIIKSPSFTNEHILAAILFEGTIDREIDGIGTAEYLWDRKGIVPILKIDKGLEEEHDGVQLMKPIPALDEILGKGADKGAFGTKERSVIKQAHAGGISRIVDQQFELADKVLGAGLVPIIEPEVDIHCPEKKAAETLLLNHVLQHLADYDADRQVMIKLTIPSVPNFYAEVIEHPGILRAVALSGGYSRHEADALLAKNHDLVASFSRALLEGLRISQSDEEFDAELAGAIKEIYSASIT